MQVDYTLFEQQYNQPLIILCKNKSSSFEFLFPPNFINPKFSRVISNHRLELPGFSKDSFYFPKTKIQGTSSKLAFVFNSKF